MPNGEVLSGGEIMLSVHWNISPRAMRATGSEQATLDWVKPGNEMEKITKGAAASLPQRAIELRETPSYQTPMSTTTAESLDQTPSG